MLLTLPVYHKITGRQKGRRTAYTHDVHSFAEFDVELVSGHEAPVALTYPDPAHAFVTDVRFHDGQFWRPEISLGAKLTPEDWTELLPSVGRRYKEDDTGRDPLGWLRFTKVHGSQIRTDEFTDDSYRDVTWSNFAEMRNRLAADLQDEVRIIEGAVYFRVQEPRYFMESNRSIVTSRIVFDRPMRTNKFAIYGDQVPVEGEFFRIDRYDDMVSHDAENFVRHESRLGPEATVMIPGVYDFRDEEASLKAISHMAWNSLESGLGRLEASVGKAWFDLRDAEKAAMADSGPEAYEELAGRLAALSEAIEAAGIKEADFHRYKSAAEHARSALSRWQMRSMDFSEGFGL